jgi:hypothetical protein
MLGLRSSRAQDIADFCLTRNFTGCNKFVILGGLSEANVGSVEAPAGVNIAWQEQDIFLSLRQNYTVGDCDFEEE